MPAFLSQALEDLTRQLIFAPPARRRIQIDQAEALYWEINPERNYPLEYVIYRITLYRPDTVEPAMLTGTALRHDLLVMVERLSGTLDDPAEEIHPPPLDLPSLCKRLNVTSKTVSRWRRQGLFARRLRWRDGRKRVAFLPQSVERFLVAHPQRVQRAAQFSRIDLLTRRRIIDRARRLAGRVKVSPFRVAQFLAGKTGRTVEGLRQLLLTHDQRHSHLAIFVDHRPPLSQRQHRVIYRAYHFGVPVSKMARRFGRARDAIYRAINQCRAERLRNLTIHFITSPTFEMPDAEQVILASDTPDAGTAGESRSPSASLEAGTELALFVRYNYLKFRAASLRDTLDRNQPRSGEIDMIETLMRRAAATRQLLVRSHLGLVISVARKHQASSHARQLTLSDLISEGNLVLLETIETYDAGKGNRFSTYLTWSLMRRFAKFTGSGRSRAVALESNTGQEATSWMVGINTDLADMEHQDAVGRTLTKLLGELVDERERLVVQRHFGLASEAGQRRDPQTLVEVAKELGISAERARQIEQRALQKLRTAAARMKVSLGDADLFSPTPPKERGTASGGSDDAVE